MSLAPLGTASMELAPAQAMAESDRAVLRRAVRDLEHRSLATRLSGVLGRQVARIGSLLPAQWAAVVDDATEKAIRVGLAAAIRSVRSGRSPEHNLWHKAAATLSGAAGGAFGLASLPIELPFSTLLMLRSIAAIAKAEGEDISSPETIFACMQVFAFAGESSEERAGMESRGLRESGYFAVRAVLAKSVTEAARYVLERGLAEEAAPVILRVVSQIATRFGVVVSQKLAAQSVPIIGAAGGAAVNYAFIDHFQTVARGHFTVRRLERIYGADVVRAEYDAVLGEMAPTAAA